MAPVRQRAVLAGSDVPAEPLRERGVQVQRQAASGAAQRVAQHVERVQRRVAREALDVQRAALRAVAEQQQERQRAAQDAQQAAVPSVHL